MRGSIAKLMLQVYSTLASRRIPSTSACIASALCWCSWLAAAREATSYESRLQTCALLEVLQQLRIAFYGAPNSTPSRFQLFALQINDA
jgi:hypothetical protein